ncbi:ATP-dependent DNA ligase [Glycomyces sp. NEAU-7082]|uniref:ATP-dependent DNA ligase n=1 Tax=Glycomyces albidus TaxID=2656774 RepID=A0A6L5GCH3_9ACTN|nr:ATP-dependent DNA ligase [Glycomyces albidus]
MKVSSPDKELFPGEGITKADLIGHYRTVAAAMLPHLAGRPLTLRRYPEGIGQEGFFQKHAEHLPGWVRTVTLAKSAGGTAEYVLCEDEATLVYLAAHGTIELHIRPVTVASIDHPDRLVVDIDPPDGVPVQVLRTIARRARELFLELGLPPFLQSTGGRGFHVVAPLDRSQDHRFVRDLAGDLAAHLARSAPDALTVQQRIDKRGHRVFLDVNRNGRGQTFVAPYSLRARPGAGVATPLDWNELGRATPDGHTIASMRRRLARKRDPWADLDACAVPAGEARERLDALIGPRLAARSAAARRRR